MEKLPLRKQLIIIKLYFDGLSYDEIATKANVSKGSVSNVISDLKAGRFPKAGDIPEQIELLRELAVDLKQSRLTPGQAAVGVIALSRFHEFGLEPADLQRFASVCHTLTPDVEVQDFTRAVLAIDEVQKRTGLDIDALEERAHNLEQTVAELEPLAQQVGEYSEQVEELASRRQRLVDEVSGLEKRLEPLTDKVAHQEKREAELFHRVQELEQRAQAADERLNTARWDLEVLTGLGVSVDNLSAFVQRVSSIAQRHSIKPDTLRERLLRELEQLEKGVGLEALVKMNRQELAKTKRTIAKAQEELTALEAALQELRHEHAALRAVIAQERRNISKEAQAVALLARDTVARLKRSLRDGVDETIAEVQKLKNRSLELGKELGHFETMVQSNQWLQALLTLVKGDADVSSDQARVIGCM